MARQQPQDRFAQEHKRQAEGPYVDVQPNERLGDEIDASLFRDDDGSVYFVWHCGKLRKMKADLSGPAEPMRKLTLVASDPNPKHHSDLCLKIHGPNSFDHIGYEGVFLFKVGGTYILSASDHCDGRYSAWIATSKSIYGPYSARYEAIPGAATTCTSRIVAENGGRRYSTAPLPRGPQSCRSQSEQTGKWRSARRIEGRVQDLRSCAGDPESADGREIYAGMQDLLAGNRDRVTVTLPTAAAAA